MQPGRSLAPGFIDMHVHLREPGFPQKETIATGTQAALQGGFTAVACMPNTQPALDTPEVLTQLATIAARDARCRLYPIAAITRGREGGQIVDFAALARCGAVAFSDDGNTVASARVLRDAALRARGVAGVFISHAEDEELKGNAVMTAGPVADALGLAGAPSVSEDVIVARDLLIGLDTGKAWHIAHLSTARALELVRWSRAQGGTATCEVTPHHLLLTDETVRERGAGAKVNPPLRSQGDARALRDGVRDGSDRRICNRPRPAHKRRKSGRSAKCRSRVYRSGNCDRRVCIGNPGSTARPFRGVAFDESGADSQRRRRNAGHWLARGHYDIRRSRVDG